MYALFGDERDFTLYRAYLEIPLADATAREEMTKNNPESSRVLDGFMRGGSDANDAKYMFQLFRLFRHFSSVKEVIATWEHADHKLGALMQLGEKLHRERSVSALPEAALREYLSTIDRMNAQLASDEAHFADLINRIARRLLWILSVTIAITTLLLFGIGLLISIMIARNIIKLDRAKKEFITFASHELRTPIALIAMNCELLTSPNDYHSERDTILISEISRATKHLLLLSSNFLTASKIDLGMITLDVRAVDIKELLTSEIAEIRPLCMQKGISIRNLFGEGIPLVKTDPILLEIVIQNLLSNAMKYTHAGGKITVTLHRIHSQFIVIGVHDTGMGISQVEQRKIFTKFSRGKEAEHISIEGVGLGLYIARLFVEKLNGTLHVHSIEHKGSTFFIRLPIIA
jgi:signal transduction histidine kinase